MSTTTSPEAPRARRNRWPQLGAVLLLMAGQVYLVREEIASSTPTVDEVAHLPAGQTYLETGTFKLYRHSPPLARMLAAGCGWEARPSLDYTRTWVNDQPANHWRFAFETIAGASATPTSQGRYLEFFDRGRNATLLLSALTIPLLYWWGSEWFGGGAGLLAAVLWTFCPNILAHSGLVTTDIPATSLGLLATYLFWRWMEKPTWTRAGWASVGLGLAQLVKFSSLWLYFIFAGWLLVAQGGRLGSLPRRGMGYVAIAMGSVLIINLGYLFEGTGTALSSFPFLSASLTRPRLASDPPMPATNNIAYREVWGARSNRFQGTVLANVPCPLPYHFVAGFDEQKFEAEGKYPMYLRGKFAESVDPTAPGLVATKRRGWWWYYFYALWVKVPASTWVLFALALGVGLVSAERGKIGTLVVLGAIPLLAMSFLTDINLGLRYVLPALPFVYLASGSLLARGRGLIWRLVAGVLVLWNVVEVASVHPHELSYFQRLVGGPAEGRFHLIDSNIDWGQDLRMLSRWLKSHPEWAREIRLAYMGSVPPEFEGIARYELAPRDLRYVPDFRLLPTERREQFETWGPLPGKYAVSVNLERGMRFHTPAPLAMYRAAGGRLGGALLGGAPMIEIPKGAYAYFQYLTPRVIPEIGYSLLLYDVSLEEANRVRGLLGLKLLEGNDAP